MAQQRLDKIIASTGRYSRREVKTLVRERAVVGQKQQPLRVLIEPPDGEKADLAVLGRKQV